MAFCEFINVHKRYQMGDLQVSALSGMNFSFERGELVVILGPSGAGKTTVLNLLGGMDSLSEGEIYLDDSCVSRMSEAELCEYRRKKIGFVFQFYNLIQNLTALENVELARQLVKDALSARAALVAVGLEERADNFPSQLSGGEQQRVAIARALAKNPQLLLCDEPTGALDYKTGKMILKLLQETSRQMGTTVAIVTHNSAFKDIADRVIEVREGKAFRISQNLNPKDALEIEW